MAINPLVPTSGGAITAMRIGSQTSIGAGSKASASSVRVRSTVPIRVRLLLHRLYVG